MQEPISPEIEVALAELKAGALFLRRANTGNSGGGGVTSSASGEIYSSGSLLRELSFRQVRPGICTITTTNPKHAHTASGF